MSFHTALVNGQLHFALFTTESVVMTQYWMARKTCYFSYRTFV